jgi:LemA protein
MIQESRIVKRNWEEIEESFYICKTLLVKFLVHSRNHFGYDEESLNHIERRISKLIILLETEVVANSLKQLQETLERTLVELSIYADQKLDEDLKLLVNQLYDIENKIVLCLHDYNAAITIFNQWLTTFPNSISANIIGVEPLPYLLMEEE